GKNSLNRLIRCVCGKKIGPDPRNFNQRVCLGRNDLLIRTFLSSTSIYLTVSGRRVGWHSYGKDGNGEDILLPTPTKDKCMFSAEHEITKRFDEICALQQKLEAKKKDIESNVWAALNSVTTVKRLIEVWPESKELLPKEADKASTALPALRVEDLNKMIGLPSEAA
ncbi:Nmad5 family putative nucleotide modification protein, partial [Escherichia coli]|uniref:Nmad5 family putative nucleotide modification protein n=1 Tax=Escherichia coli TaxID=562 RepID=UPI00374CF2CF